MRYSVRELKTTAVFRENRRKPNPYANLGERMKAAFLRRRKHKTNDENDHSNGQEYATDKVSEAVERITDDTVHTGGETVRTVIHNRKPPHQNPSGGAAFSVSGSKLKYADRSMKTVEKTVGTVQTPVAEAKRSAQIAAAAQQAVRKMDIAAENIRFTATRAKRWAEATARTVKGMLTASNQLMAALIGGGAVAVTVIVIVLMIGMMASSSYGIFFSNEEIGNGSPMMEVIREINRDFTDRLDFISATVPHDEVEMTGTKARWQEVLSVYAVQMTGQGGDVVSMDDDKRMVLEELFWKINTIDYEIETRTEQELQDVTDEDGNTTQQWVDVDKRYLVITVTGMTLDEILQELSFTDSQKAEVQQLLGSENDALWSKVLYGFDGGGAAIVAVAESQIGNVGGQPYWSWYGFNGRVEWCACFVSWCANECGYIEDGIIPRFSGVGTGVQWFRSQGQWLSGRDEPAPGMIIFFDWEANGGVDHVGIVSRVENGMVYAIEGNTTDSCRERFYPLGHSEIYGYGVPEY